LNPALGAAVAGGAIPEVGPDAGRAGRRAALFDQLPQARVEAPVEEQVLGAL
jgi:hypothetical protein